MIDFGFLDILDLENVRIDTKVKSASCIQLELMKVIQCMCVTLSSKVNRQGHGFVFHFFDIHDLENVRIDTKINFVSCLQPEIWKVMQKGVWPWFSRSYNKDGIFSLSPLDSLTPKTYPWEIFPKNSHGKTKIQGGWYPPPPPPGRPKVDFYLGHLRVNYQIVTNTNISKDRPKCCDLLGPQHNIFTHVSICSNCIMITLCWWIK